MVICGEKSTFDVAKWMGSRANQQFEIAAITVAELWHGIEIATLPHRLRRERYLRNILDALPIIPSTELAAMEHALIWAELESSGKRIGSHDLILAATVVERDRTVRTFNRRHIEAVNELKVIKPK